MSEAFRLHNNTKLHCSTARYAPFAPPALPIILFTLDETAATCDNAIYRTTCKATSAPDKADFLVV